MEICGKSVYAVEGISESLHTVSIGMINKLVPHITRTIKNIVYIIGATE